MIDRDELIKALEHIKQLCRSEDVRQDIYGFGGHGRVAMEALDEIDDLVHAQLAKLEESE